MSLWLSNKEGPWLLYNSCKRPIGQIDKCIITAKKMRSELIHALELDKEATLNHIVMSEHLLYSCNLSRS